MSQPENSSQLFLVPSKYTKLRMSYKITASDSGEEEINNFLFENIYNLTGVQNVHSKSTDHITREIVARDPRKAADTCENYKDTFLYMAVAYYFGLAAFGRFSTHLSERDENSTFLFAYITMVLFTAYPIAFLDMTLGQYTSKGPLLVFDYCPLFEGIGYSMTMFCLIEPLPIVMNIAYSIFYMFLALSPEFPWNSCNAIVEKLDIINGTGCSEVPTATTDIPVVYFWKVYMQRDHTYGVYANRGIWHWTFVSSQIVTWLFISYCLYKGCRSAYKVIRITFLPSVCFILLFFAISIRTMGITTFFSTYWVDSWKHFFSLRTWTEATIQAFLSIGASSGVLLTLGSFYDFRNKLVHKHMLIIILVSVIIHILIGMFMAINMDSISKKYNTNIRMIFPEGMNLLFLVFPEKIRHWPFPQFFLIIFYFAFAMLQIIAVVVLLETFKLCIFSKIPYVAEHKTFWTFMMCTIYLLITLLNTSGTPEGFISDVILSAVVGRALIVIGIAELISICIFYGFKKFCIDVEFMRNSRPSFLLRFSWIANIFVLIPIAIVLIRNQFKDYTSTYNDISNYAMGLIITTMIQESILIPIPIVMVLNTYKFLNKRNLVGVIKPRPTAGPKYGIFKAMRESFFDGIEHNI